MNFIYRMRWFAGILIFCLPIISALGSENRSATADEIVWHWFAQCVAAEHMSVEVSLDGKQIFATSFDVCHMPRSAITLDSSQKTLKFDFNSKRRSFFGERKGENLEGNIWEASKDEDELVLGVSFSDKNRIWLNTLHILNPKKLSQSTIENGLVIRTFPTSETTP